MAYLLRVLVLHMFDVADLGLCCCKNSSDVIVGDIESGGGRVQFHMVQTEPITVGLKVPGGKVDDAKYLVDGGSPTDVHHGGVVREFEEQRIAADHIAAEKERWENLVHCGRGIFRVC